MFDSILQKLTLTMLDVYAIPVAALAFYFFYRVLSRDVFTPYLSIYEERESAVTGSAASSDREQASVLEAQYESELSKKRAELVRQKLEITSLAQKEADKLIADAEQKSADEISNFKAQLSKDMVIRKASLPDEARRLAQTIVERVGGVG
jgi:F0F1-type ATP synthase membrane subunit b/b'